MQNIHIRPYVTGDETALREVFYSAIHQTASQYYSAEQRNAWAPKAYDQHLWAHRIATLNPFIAIVDNQIAGYADLQKTGYIDHFFVAAFYANQGVGRALMQHLHSRADRQDIKQLSADVSLAAERFFTKHGFVIQQRKTVVISGVALQNALMVKVLF